jgi:disulfide bond formation protein DsbB
MTDIAPAARTHPQTALFLAVAMLAVVGSALAFQYIGGFLPCKLCYEQRLPYYFGAPLMLVAFVSSLQHKSPLLVRGLFLVGGLLMAYNLYLGVYHAGVEWAWWAGPTDCGMVAAPTSSAGTLLDDINKVVPPSCDKAALRILGLSMAGWNAIASLILAVVAFKGALARR